MESIFYATLALYIAGKPINKENIMAVLNAAGTPIDEPALDAMAAFVEALAARRDETQKSSVDPRIIKFLSSELEQRKVQTQELDSLLEQLTKMVPASTASEGNRTEENTTPEKTTEENVAKKQAPPPEKLAGASTGTSSSIATSGPQQNGRYVYGIAEGGETVALGPIGLEGDEVYTIPYQNLSAIVHNCHLEPYESKDDEVVKNWARAHQNVLDEAKKVFGTIIPLGFDTILQPKEEGTTPEEVVRNWLKDDYERLTSLMAKIRDKDEYSIQVSYEPAVVSKQIAEKNEEVQKIKEEMASKSPGLAYMYRQKLEQAVKIEMEKLADQWFKDFYCSIKQHVDDIVVEKTKKLDKEKVMLLNFSCLVSRDKIKDLGDELERINNMDGFAVRFTGPWPAYSFVSAPVVEGA